jgi:hypothetical protein
VTDLIFQFALSGRVRRKGWKEERKPYPIGGMIVKELLNESKNEIERGGHQMNEEEPLDEIFELALQNDMNYLG